MLATLEKVFAEAILNPGNISARGDINWSFVDSDCYMAVVVAHPNANMDDYCDAFNKLIDTVAV